MRDSLACPLCGGRVKLEAFHRDATRDYYRCSVCCLVFVPPDQWLDAASEKAIYDQHQNKPDDENYRAFLRRLTDPLATKLSPQAAGLDFGSGPGPTLSLLMQESGYSMQIYDPFYAPEHSVLDQVYDFITATEVLEHLHRPGTEIQKLSGMIKQFGWLGIMTKRIPKDKPFAEWHYTRDPTHVIFFADETFDWIAEQFGFGREFIGNDVALLQKY